MSTAPQTPAKPPVNPNRPAMLPGVAVIALWMLLMAVVGWAGVVFGRFAPGGSARGALLVSTLFAVIGLGLLRLKRWGWAMATAASLMALGFGIYGMRHDIRYGGIVFMYAIFFFYLIRPAVREQFR